METRQINHFKIKGFFSKAPVKAFLMILLITGLSLPGSRLLAQASVKKVSLETVSLNNFRSIPREDLSLKETLDMLSQKDFFDAIWNFNGKGFPNDFQFVTSGVILDRSSGLIWQQSGSESPLTIKDAQSYVQELNQKKFGGFSDWRLPTIEEAMTLMERQKNPDNLFIASVFDEKQTWIWTADRDREFLNWIVLFKFGQIYCENVQEPSLNFVRAVRSGNKEI